VLIIEKYTSILQNNTHKDASSLYNVTKYASFVIIK
jgi:hypothetical protein